MKALKAIFLRELHSMIEAPIALILAIMFLIMTGITTFYFGRFFENEKAELYIFFAFHPWLYLFFLPAMAMRLWAEERQQGTIELLLTWPVPLFTIVLGKFLAAWAFVGAVLALTFPMWITVNVLGFPDNGVIIASYSASFLMAGAYLAICLCMSVITKNQVIAFILGASLCALFVMMGWPILLDLLAFILPPLFLEIFASMSFLTHFDSILLGVITLSNIIFFLIFIAAWLAAATVLIDWQTGARIENLPDRAD